VGEQREFRDGTSKPDLSSVGSSEEFDIVVLAIGFGPEKENQLSYWRNESYAQPSLAERRTTFLISGQGDGAMIDLLRVRISQYRQDRILADLFGDKHALVKRLESLRERRDTGESLFRKLEELRNGSSLASKQMQAAQEGLAHRLRSDTDAILHLLVRNLDELFSVDTMQDILPKRGVSLLALSVRRLCTSHEPVRALINRYGIQPGNIVKRHGTDRAKQLERLLPEPEFVKLKPLIDDVPGKQLRQSASRLWPGGFYGFPGPTTGMGSLGDKVRRTGVKNICPRPPSSLPIQSVAACRASWKR
jgi:hypothetical protein